MYSKVPAKVTCLTCGATTIKIQFYRKKCSFCSLKCFLITPASFRWEDDHITKLQSLVYSILETPLTRCDNDPVFVSSDPLVDRSEFVGPKFFDAQSGADITSRSMLLPMCTAAHCGYGSETILDETMRKTMTVSPVERVRIEWPQLTTEVAPAVAKYLGCNEADVTFLTHSILVYDEDSFFKPHLDSKKAPGHVATLSVLVWGEPTKPIIRFTGSGICWGAEESPSAWIAWHNTEEHEALPGTPRVVITYNIIVSPPSTTTASQATPQEKETVERCMKTGILRRCPLDVFHLIAEWLEVPTLLAYGLTCKIIHDNIVTPSTVFLSQLREIKCCIGRIMDDTKLHSLGFVLKHKYSGDGNTFIPLNSLRGRDKVLMEALQAAYPNVEITVLPCDMLLERPEESGYTRGLAAMVQHYSNYDVWMDDLPEGEVEFYPDHEIDQPIGMSFQPFLGVFWLCSRLGLGYYGSEGWKRGTRLMGELWGNEGVFEIYAYKEVCLFARLRPHDVDVSPPTTSSEKEKTPWEAYSGYFN